MRALSVGSGKIAFIRMGRLLERMFDQSEKTEEELWELTSAENPEERAEAVLELGVRCMNDARKTEAKSLFSVALNLWVQIGDNTGIGRANFANGVFLLDEKQFANAVPYFVEACACYQLENRSSWEAEALWRLAIAYKGLDELELQMETLKLSIALSVSIDEFEKASQGEIELGLTLCLHNRQSEGLASYNRALEYAQLAEDPILCLKAQNMQAMALIELGDHDKAFAKLRLNLDSALYLGNEELIAIIKNDLGQTMIELGLFEEGLELITPQSNRWKSANLFESALGVDLARAEALIGMQRFVEAQDLLKQLESISTTIGNQNKLACVCGMLAEVLMWQGDSDVAFDYFNKSISLSNEIQKAWVARESTLSMAEVLVQKGDFNKALELLDTLSAEEAGDSRTEIARSFACHAQAAALKGDFQAVEQDSNSLVELGDHFGVWPYQATGLEVLSGIYSREGDQQKSKDIAELASELRNRYALRRQAEILR